jgi:hypothetical protein
MVQLLKNKFITKDYIMKKFLYFICFVFFTINSYSNVQIKPRYVIDIDSNLVVISHTIAQSQVGVTEKTGKNDGEVDKYMRFLNKGGQKLPYCSGGISWSYYQGALFLDKDRKYIPFPLSAGSQVAFDYARKKGKLDNSGIKRYDFFIWKKKDGINGHIGLIDSVMVKGCVRTIEFNTSQDNRGSQRDGGGVWNRKRNLIQPMGFLLVRGFVGFNLVDKKTKIDWKKFNPQNYREFKIESGNKKVLAI